MNAAIASPPPSSRIPRGHLRILGAASLGNALEWYDFTIYVLFAAQIAKHFFPGGAPAVELIKAFLAFGVGFVVRPVGAVLIGRYADRAGRKAALTLTIALMALGTLLLAVAPTYAAIGLGGPLIVLTARILQGFSAGGEVGGAAAFLVEHAPHGRRGLYAAFLQASMAASNILGAVVALALTQCLSQTAIDDWAWRLPFALGLLIAPVGIWLRRTLHETPEFVAAAAAEPDAAAPLRRLLADHSDALVRGTGLSVLWAVAVYTLIIYMPVHLQRSIGAQPGDVFLAAVLGNLVLAAACFASGALADRFGRRRVLTLSAAALLILVTPLLLAVRAQPTLPVLILAQCAFGLLVGLYSGAAPAALAELFPARVRSSGMSIVYNTAVTIFGGFAPAILTWLEATPFGPSAPAAYVTAAAVVGLAAVVRLETSPVDRSPARSCPAL